MTPGIIKKLYHTTPVGLTDEDKQEVYPITATSAVYSAPGESSFPNMSLDNILDALNQGYQYMGKATPTTNPGVYNHKVFYLASDPGTYSYFGNIEVSSLTVLKTSGNGWTADVFNITGGGGGGTAAGYIGTTMVQNSPAPQNLGGISQLNLTSGARIYFGETAYIELDQYGFHFSQGIYSDSFVAAGGIGSGGGGGGGSVTIVNDLTTGGTTSALSAEMGKTLKSYIDAGYIFKGFATCDTRPPEPTPYPICYIGVESGYYFDFYGNPYIPLRDGQVVFLSRRANWEQWDTATYTISTGSGGGGGQIPAASSSTIGGILLGYTQNNKNYPVVLDGNNRAYVNVPWEGGGSGGGGTVTSVTLTQGNGISITDSGVAITTFGSRTISIASATLTKIENGNTAYGWGNHALAGYAMATDLTSLNTRVVSIEDWFEVVTVNGQQALHAKSSRAIYSDSWIAAGGIGSGSSGGGTDLNRVWDSLTNNTDKPNVKINIAHIPDITTSKITDLESWIVGKGYLTSSALNGYATRSWVQQQGYLTSFTETDPTVPSWAKAQSKPSYSLSEISGTDDLRAIEALTGTAGLLKKTAANTWSLDTTQYLSAHQSVTLASGTNNGTLKLTTAAGTVDNIVVKGLQALAYKASLLASDIPDLSGTYVTLSTTQTITGAKTFSGGITMLGANILTSADSTNSIGASGTRFLAGHIRNFYTTYLGFMSDNGQAQTGVFDFGDGRSTIHLLKPDGTEYGTYSFFGAYGFFHSGNGDVPCGRSDHRWSEVWAEDADLSGNLDVAGVVRVNTLNTIDQSNASMSLFNHGARATKSFNAYGTSINFRACDSNGDQVNILAINATKIQAGSDLIPSYTEGLNLGGSSANTRWATIYGVNANLSGNLSLSSASYIDIGPVRITYDSDNEAIHITTNDATNHPTIGFYADGFVAAGGVGQTS